MMSIFDIYICNYEFDYPKIGKAAITLNLANHNLSEKLILPVTKTAEAMKYQWLSRKQIQEKRVPIHIRPSR